MTRVPPGAERLGPGIYAHNGELHVELDEYIRAAGGDPHNPADVAKAIEVIERVAGGEGIPVDVREDR